MSLILLRLKSGIKIKHSKSIFIYDNEHNHYMKGVNLFDQKIGFIHIHTNSKSGENSCSFTY